MQTKYNVGDTVLVPAKVSRIFVTDKNIFYRVKIHDDDGGGIITIDKKEESIANAET